MQPSFKFNKSKYFFLFLIFFLGSIIYSLLITIKPSDHIAYDNLMEISDPSLKAGAQKSRQHRKNVQKDMLVLKGEERLLMRIHSEDAVIVMCKTEIGNEIKEYMKGVKCWIQEEKFYQLPDGTKVERMRDGRLIACSDSNKWIPDDKEGLVPMQKIRYIESDHAVYDYRTDLLVADEVTLTTFIAPEHDLSKDLLVEDPFFSGVSKTIEMSMVERGFNIKAENLKATIDKLERSL